MGTDKDTPFRYALASARRFYLHWKVAAERNKDFSMAARDFERTVKEFEKAVDEIDRLNQRIEDMARRLDDR